MIKSYKLLQKRHKDVNLREKKPQTSEKKCTKTQIRHNNVNAGELKS